MSKFWVNGAGAWVAAAICVAAIGWVDFVSGSELRVFPLYFGPIALVAWQGDRRAVLAAALLCAVAWGEANSLAGMEYSHWAIWVANGLVQATSFAVVGLLIATLRDGLERERELGRIDPLTSLLNRRAFREEADPILALCRRKERPATLAYLDLDNFKTVNNTRGHQAGDVLLRAVAAALVASKRPTDICARLGGDEFALVLPEVDAREATVVLERLRAKLSETIAKLGHPVTASIGAVTFLAVPEGLDQMVSAADARMYAAKAAGKDRLHLEVVGRAPS